MPAVPSAASATNSPPLPAHYDQLGVVDAARADAGYHLAVRSGTVCGEGCEVSRSADRITMECPNCGGTWEEWALASFESDLDPQLADPGWMRAHATATCPHCGRTACCAAPPAERELWH